MCFVLGKKTKAVNEQKLKKKHEDAYEVREDTLRM